MYYFKGDTVKLIDGQVVEIIDSWGVARNWYKFKTKDGQSLILMQSSIHSLVLRPSNKSNGRMK